MKQFELTQASYVDFDAMRYFIACGVIGPSFTLRHVKVDGETVPLVQVGGTRASDGALVNVSIWPRDHASAQDLIKLPAGRQLDNFVFRIGYHDTVDRSTGECTTVQGAPKAVRFHIGGDEFALSGKKREFETEPVAKPAAK